MLILLFTGISLLLIGLAVGYLVTGSLPLIESLFQVLTDISLLELSNIAQQTVLRRLLIAAPGTYNHSINVASIAEAAAEGRGQQDLPHGQRDRGRGMAVFLGRGLAIHGSAGRRPCRACLREYR